MEENENVIVEEVEGEREEEGQGEGEREGQVEGQLKTKIARKSGEKQVSTKDASQLNSAIQSINYSKPIKEVPIISSDFFQTIPEETISNLEEKNSTIQEALSIIKRTSSTAYDEFAWLNFLDAYAAVKRVDVKQLIQDFNSATPLQKKELYTYFKRDPLFIVKLSLGLYDNIQDYSKSVKIMKYENKKPVIYLTNVPELGDLLMLADGGVITGDGKEVVWNNESRDVGKFKLGFRQATMLDTNRLLQNENQGLTRGISGLTAAYYNKNNIFNNNTGGKTKKLKNKRKSSKSKSNSKNKRKSKRTK